MPKKTPKSSDVRSAKPSGSMTDRVGRRVAAAVLASERRAKSVRPKGARRVTAAADLEKEKAAHLAQSLRAVFRELGDTHRQYRERTGNVGTAALRQAANAFKREPTMDKLAAVAVFLDELGLLEW
jgi:hypothetical protein